MLNKNIFILLPIILVFGLSACSNENADAEKTKAEKPIVASANIPVEISAGTLEWDIIPLPDISQQPISLSVANVVNSRFKQLSDKQLKAILLRSQQMVKLYFNIDVQFSSVKTIAIDEVFNRLDPQVKNNRRAEIVNIQSINKQVREDMQASIFETLSNYSANKQNVINYAQPHLLHSEKEVSGFIDLSYALVDTLIARLQYWTKQKASDGLPVLDSSGYHEWVWWDSLGYSDLPYDILITNQLVASAEYYAMDVHSSLRGGITAGTTTYSKNTASRAYAYIMLYPMLNDSKLLTELRQDEHYSEEQIINYSAALLTHELGHLLLHLGHPFGNKNCIMSPTLMLNYRDWYNNFKAVECAPGSMAEMEPGAANLNFNKHW